MKKKRCDFSRVNPMIITCGYARNVDLILYFFGETKASKIYVPVDESGVSPTLIYYKSKGGYCEFRCKSKHKLTHIRLDKAFFRNEIIQFENADDALTFLATRGIQKKVEDVLYYV